MFANIDYVGIVDYVIKAVLGAAVWYGFKFLQEYFSTKMRHRAEQLLKGLENKPSDSKTEENKTESKS
jgi:hypothetical protein